jgi:Fe-S oxidoreductase
MGLQAEFKKHASDVFSRLKAHGVSKIIGIVPSCTYTLKNLLVKAVGDTGIEVNHFSQVVAENLSSLSLRYPKQARVTYHDPCQLVRYLGIVDEPRRIIRAVQGLELVEPAATSREWATCCGGGGGFEAVFPEMSQILAENRARELMETGAEIIVTHCPGCLMQLKTGLKSAFGEKAEKVEVLDLAQVVARALGE